jgi:hypothetical protein
MPMQRGWVRRVAFNVLAGAVSLSVPAVALALFSSSPRALLSDRNVGPQFRVLEPSAEPQPRATRTGDPTVVEPAHWVNTGDPHGPGGGDDKGKDQHGPGGGDDKTKHK